MSVNKYGSDELKITRWYQRPDFNTDDCETITDLTSIDFGYLLGWAAFQLEDGKWYRGDIELSVEPITDPDLLKTLHEWDGKEPEGDEDENEEAAPTTRPRS